jgi:hypothetical protein
MKGVAVRESAAGARGPFLDVCAFCVAWTQEHIGRQRWMARESCALSPVVKS